MVRLEAEQIAQMSRHAAGEYPRECLGILVGRREPGGNQIFRAVPVDNIHEQPHRRVSCLPDEYRRVECLALELGAEICGYYHSHPDHPAVPSQVDLEEAAFDEWSYVIVAVDRGHALPPRSWKLRPDRQAFEEEEIVQGGPLCLKS